MRHFTYRTKASSDVSHSELISAAKTAAGVGDWSVFSVDWYKDDHATVELVAHDPEETP